MIYIINTPPIYCPQCGKHLAKQWSDPLNYNDFRAGASHSCDCGARYQYAPAGDILAAEDKSGDLKQNAKG